MTPQEEFIARFTEIWSAPDPSRFPELFVSDGWLLHPGMTERLPVSEVVGYLEGVVGAVPDVHLKVADWAERGGVLYVDWTMHATVDGQAISWMGADKCVLRGDRAVSITAFFDTYRLWVNVDPTLAREESLEEATAKRAALQV